MGEFVIKLPDVGEGVAEAELVEWLVEEGKNVREDDVLASVMTDKATVEIPSPVEGKVIWLGPEIGEVVAVGSPIIRLEVEGEGNAAALAEESAPQEKVAPRPAAKAAVAPVKPSSRAPAVNRSSTATQGVMRAEGEAPLASPAVRKRALDAGVDLRQVPGSGPVGRISHEDLDIYFTQMGGGFASALVADTPSEQIPVIGLRRKIAEKMATAKSRIPHITYVDEIDVTVLEEKRKELNAAKTNDQPKLTMLPFLMRAMAIAIKEQPQMSALYDDHAGVIHQYESLNMGVAAQTDKGLVVPVVRHVEEKDIWACANELGRLAEAAKAGTASREDLSGSTITITSLGALGGIVTTPVINHPEVAIIGVNKMQILPHWDGEQFIPRKKMNLSSSFDHRVIDGWNAAVFIQRIKELLESPTNLLEDH